jgi:hypothetical protein
MKEIKDDFFFAFFIYSSNAKETKKEEHLVSH